MKKICLSFILTVTVITCCAQSLTIHANITGFKDSTQVILYESATQSNIDSTVIVNNKFSFKHKVTTEPANYWLEVRADGKLYYTIVMVGNDDVTLSGDKNDMPWNMKVKGPESERVFQLLYNDKLQVLHVQRDTLVMQAMSMHGDSAQIKSRLIWNKIKKIDSADRVLRNQFIHNHLNSYLALDELFYQKAMYTTDSLQHMYNSLLPKYKNSSYGKRIGVYLKVGDELKEGDNFVDFSGFDKNGKLHKVSEIKGRYVLLDFSGTYCGPCVMSVKDMRNLNKKYVDNLSIITVSQDVSKAMWMEGVNRDKPEWLSLWDGKGITGETSMKYGVMGIPDFCLIDPQGKIIARITGYSDGYLEKRISEILDKHPLP